MTALAWLTMAALAASWDAHNIAGTRLQEQAKFRAAADEYVAALNLLNTAGKRDADFARVKNNLATVHARLGQGQDAELAYREAEAIWRELGPSAERDLGRTLANLSSLYHQRGDARAATSHLTEAVYLQRRTADPLLFNSLTILANIHMAQSNYRGAESALREAQALAATYEHVDPLKLAATDLALCWLYTAEGKLDEASAAAQRAVVKIVQVAGKDSSHYATCLLRIGRLDMMRGDLNGGERKILEALKLYQVHLGSDSLLAARALVDLAILRRNAKQYDRALSLMDQALAAFQKGGGALGSEYATTLLIVSEFHRGSGDLAKAEDTCREALRLLEANHGPESVMLASPLNNLATILYARKQKDAAEALVRRALTLREKALGPAHPELADSLYNLGVMELETGRLADAEQHLQRSLALRQQSLGDRHPALLPALASYIDVLKASGRKDQAKVWLQTARAIQSERDSSDPALHTVSMTEFKTFRPQ